MLRSSRFLSIFLPGLLLLLLGLGLHARSGYERALAELQTRERLQVGLGAGALARGLELAARDLDFLAHHVGLHRMLERPEPAQIDAFALDLVRFSRSRGIYDQLRWIDREGNERVRVDYAGGEPQVIPAHALQNKADRYYFSESLQLPPGQVYVSPLDLNIERGVVERPYKPMIRLASPVADAGGQVRGVLVINYYGSHLVGQLLDAATAIADHLMLVDTRGYWLRHPDPSREWGFMLDAPQLTLARDAPAAWQHIAAGPAGQVALGGGMWTWQSVSLRGDLLPAGLPIDIDGRSTHGYPWKVVAHLPAATLAALTHTAWLGVLPLFVLLLVPLGWGCWKLASVWTQRDEAELGVRAANAGLKRQVELRTQSLREKIDELAQSESRFRAVFESAAVGIARMSIDGRFVDINEAFCSIIGYPRAEVLEGALSFQQITHPDDLAADLQRAGQLLDGLADTYAMEKRYFRKDGTVVWVNLSVSLLRDAEGRPLHFIGSVVDITERKRLEAELVMLANSDFLTGLPNRRAFMGRLEEEYARVKRRTESSAAVLMLDIDHFKRINDAHGHAAGDLMLRHVAELIEHELRRIDAVGRIGGEEFAIVMPGADGAAARALAERLRERIAETPLAFDDQPILASVSIGVALMQADDASSEAALHRADAALYRAKDYGRDRVEDAFALP